ncbi:siderophore-interacting protein [Naasia sp. SYSU D00057]|uniref:siderophore-interacting protein n=1 Tax=Naasia sp. SYSU D00057 TaxID=2817380 RepID=UPI001B30D454|nr:siderophore-interacting protein [Naasia sp. SYSU D00057]
MSEASFSRETVRHELAARELRVVRRERLTSSLTRITVGGDQLAGFSALGPEDHVKLFFPSPNGERISRDYTPAAFDADALELSLDFVLHGDDGPASRFASGALAGDPLVVAGPRGSRMPPSGAKSYVLLADEAALPALGRWVAAVGVEAQVTAFVQSDHADVLDYPLAYGNRVTVTAIPTGADAALAALEGPSIDAATYVWAAGEAAALIPVRRALRAGGLAKDRAKVDGYWRKGVAGLDHHAPLDPENPED